MKIWHLWLAGLLIGIACAFFLTHKRSATSGSLAYVERILSQANAGEGPVLARVDGLPITLAEAQESLKQYPETYRNRVYTGEWRKNFLNALIRQKILTRLAERDGTRDPQFRLELKLHLENMLTGSYRAYLLKTMPHAPQNMTSEDDTSGEPIFSRIVLPSLPEARRALALLKNGELFEDVAQSISNKNRLLPQNYKPKPFSNLTNDPVLDGVVRSLKNGQISDVIQTHSGYEIVRRDGTKFSPELQARLRMEEDYIDARLEKAKPAIKIEINETVLPSLNPATSFSK